MRLSEYSFLLEKESARLNKPLEGTICPGMAMPGRGGVRVTRMPHEDRCLMAGYLHSLNRQL